MSSIIWVYNPGVSDSTIVARDQMVGLENDKTITTQLVTLSDTNRFSAIEQRRSKVSVPSTSGRVTITKHPDAKAENVLMVINPNDIGNDVIDVAMHFDEIWIAPIPLVNELVASGIDESSIYTFAPYTTITVPLDTHRPPADRPIALLHEQNDRMVEINAFIRAWLMLDWTKEFRLIVSCSGNDVNQLPNMIRNIRMDIGEKGKRKISVLKQPNADDIDACVQSSEIICCLPGPDSGWKPLAIKAAISGKMVISTRSGVLPQHIQASEWINAPDRYDICVGNRGGVVEALADAYMADMEQPPHFPAQLLPQISSVKPFTSLCIERAPKLMGDGV